MNYLIILQLLFLASCSFKAKNEEKKTERNEYSLSLKNLDSDGDLVNDYDELEVGDDPLVADLPEIKVNFLQDYEVSLKYENEKQFVIDTKVGRDDSDFKYRVGSLLLRENSFDNAARIGKFSGISTGEIKQRDLSWVKYPDVDKDFYHERVNAHEEFEEFELKESKIILENNLKLLPHKRFNEISKLEVNFYYYSHEKESYELVHTELIDKTFQSGINERFSVEITNLPKELIYDSYLRRGEFLISEVKDFYIPALKTSYKKLKAAVKNKSIPVHIVTPFESTIKYASVGKSGSSFIDILKTLYGENFKVQNEKLVKIAQFENDLPNFTYLSELKDQDKLGKWFVMTNKIKEHYLKHKFITTDSISLSFITGAELSRRSDEVIFSKRVSIESGDSEKLYPLGNVSSNSKIELSIFPESLQGIRLIKDPSHFYFKPRCRGRGNCSGTNWWMDIFYSINSFKEFQEDFEYETLELALDKLELLVNNTTIPVKELLEKNKARIELDIVNEKQILRISLWDLSEFGLIDTSQENAAFIKLKSIAHGVAGEGIEVERVEGHNIKKRFHAMNYAMSESVRRRIKVSPKTLWFNEWARNIKWGTTIRGEAGPYKLTKGEMIKHFESQVVSLVSTITNYSN